MHEPAVLAQACRGHQGRQPVPLSGRRGHHGHAARPALRLADAGRDEPLADGAGPVLGGDRHLARGPAVADAAQRGRDDLLAQLGQRHAARQPGHDVPGLGLVAAGNRGVQPVRLGAPVAHPDLGARRRARGPAGGQHGGVGAVADPAMSGPVNAVAPEPVRNAGYAATLAAVLRRPAVVPVPGLAPRLLLGADGAAELARASQRVWPQRLTRAGHHFRHSGLDQALRHMLGRTREAGPGPRGPGCQAGRPPAGEPAPVLPQGGPAPGARRGRGRHGRDAVPGRHGGAAAAHRRPRRPRCPSAASFRQAGGASAAPIRRYSGPRGRSVIPAAGPGSAPAWARLALPREASAAPSMSRARGAPRQLRGPAANGR
ncbi:MAG TPA: DUF1731 domain-containing protein [Streptosporangiaceae bacterium]|nr:DUF1731 domain-containing protein [Streptosporangiaceae bacterium]